MKCFEIPAPKCRRQYSSKLSGRSAASAVPELRLDHPQQALLDHLGRQPVQVRLVGVARQHAVGEDSGLARDRNHLPGQQLVDQLLDAGVAQVQPVPGLVEAVPVALVGARVAAQPLVAFEQQPGRAQVRRGRDPRQPAAQNHDRVHDRVGLRVAAHVGRYLPTPGPGGQNARRPGPGAHEPREAPLHRLRLRRTRARAGPRAPQAPARRAAADAVDALPRQRLRTAAPRNHAGARAADAAAARGDRGDHVRRARDGDDHDAGQPHPGRPVPGEQPVRRAARQGGGDRRRGPRRRRSGAGHARPPRSPVARAAWRSFRAPRR